MWRVAHLNILWVCNEPLSYSVVPKSQIYPRVEEENSTGEDYGRSRYVVKERDREGLIAGMDYQGGDVGTRKMKFEPST